MTKYWVTSCDETFDAEYKDGEPTGRQRRHREGSPVLNPPKTYDRREISRAVAFRRLRNGDLD